MCSCTCFSNFLWILANMASRAEMIITTRTASKFCAKRRAVKTPSFFSLSFLGQLLELQNLGLNINLKILGLNVITRQLFANYLVTTC